MSTFGTGAQTRYLSMPWPSDDIGVPIGPEDRRSGDDGQHHLAIQDGVNAWPLASTVAGTAAAPVTPAVQWGVCISVNVQFGQDADMSFVAAGVDFLVDVG